MKIFRDRFRDRDFSKHLAILITFLFSFLPSRPLQSQARLASQSKYVPYGPVDEVMPHLSLEEPRRTEASWWNRGGGSETPTRLWGASVLKTQKKRDRECVNVSSYFF